MSDLYYDADLINYCEELEEKLTKYKRAFEIFRANDMNVKWLLDYERITQEEYEMLEELMKDENC